MLKNKYKIILLFCSFIVVLFFSNKFIYLKKLGIAKIPSRGILDEFDFVWLGKSFLKTGIPTGWSDFGVYRDTKNNFSYGDIVGFFMSKNGQIITFSNFHQFHFPTVSIQTVDWGDGKASLNLVTPYFDHPLLAPIVFGLTKTEKENLEGFKVENFRQISVILSVITGILIFLCTFQIAGIIAGLSAFFVYSTVPTFVFLSRLALPENLIALLCLATLNFLLLYETNKKIIFIILAGIFAGLAGLAKIPGLFVILGGFIWIYWNFIFNKKENKRVLLAFLVPSILVFLLYPLYGLIVSPSLFLQVLFTQSSRFFSGSLNLINQISKPTFKNFFVDGWWIGGWFISFLGLRLFDNKGKTVLIKIFFVSLLLSIIFLAAADYPWYFIGAIPFLSIFLGMFIANIFQNPNIFQNLIFSLFLFSSSFYYGFYVLNKTNNNVFNIYRLLLLSFIVLGLLGKYLIKNRYLILLWKIFFIVVMYRLFLWNFRSITYLVANWP